MRSLGAIREAVAVVGPDDRIVPVVGEELGFEVLQGGSKCSWHVVRPGPQGNAGLPCTVAPSLILADVIDANWIDHWADRYPERSDDEVLDRIGPRVRERGFYDREDFLSVGEWKSPRPKKSMASNTDEMIRDVTATALTAPLSIQHRVLMILNGVLVPMASSLLMVWQPDEHTVIDVRAVKSLVAYEGMSDPGAGKYPPYVEYLTLCKEIAQRCNRSLRVLDRALYAANGRT